MGSPCIEDCKKACKDWSDCLPNRRIRQRAKPPGESDVVVFGDDRFFP